MDWDPEQQLDLGALEFAGICRETYRVFVRAILSSNKGGRSAALLSALFLTYIAANTGLLSLFHDILPLLDGSDLVLRASTLSKAIGVPVLLLLSLICPAAYVFRSRPPLCCTDDADCGPFDRIVRDLRLASISLYAAPLAMSYSIFSGVACFALIQLLSRQVIVGAACLAGAAYASAVLHITCVVTVIELEHADLFGAIRKGHALLAGKLWVAAAVFVPLDVCFVALQTSFLELVLEDALGLGRGFQVAAGAVVAAALWAVVAVTLVAQPVVYLVCKNHHHEVVDSGSH